jgi:UDP-2,3-diacylglucosamine hydrolase
VTASLFISDLHLDPARPAATAAFLRFLAGEARDAARLYILGDLFEFWIGDDDDAPLARAVVDALAAYAATGRECRVMRGNRDFLLGPRFEARTGARLLPDPVVETIHGERVVVMHGDLLCTDDAAYQRYRRRVNDPRLQRLFLALPRSWRRAAGVEGRRRSRRHAEERPPEIMDVNRAAVAAVLAAHGCRTLLHGHTHRPAIHRFPANGVECTRIVLGDWYEQGSVLGWDAAGGPQLRALPFG